MTRPACIFSDAQLVALVWGESGLEESQLGNILQPFAFSTGVFVDRPIASVTKVTIVHRCERIRVVVEECIPQRCGYFLLVEADGECIADQPLPCAA